MRAYTGYHWNEGYNYHAQRWYTPAELEAQRAERQAEQARQAAIRQEIAEGKRCPTCKEPTVQVPSRDGGKVYVRCTTRRCRFSAVREA